MQKKPTRVSRPRRSKPRAAGSVSAATIRSFQSRLCRWYARHKRDLPWRRTADPYAIWVSEIMLQQTQVATAGPYFERFMGLFPTVSELAAAPIDKVLKAWEGLGYYSRARNLHAAAGVVVRDFSGKLPSSPQDLLKLPGIGRYTAGAIASIAFGLDEPVLDGNVTRVLCRAFGIAADPKQARTHERLWELARLLVPAGKASLFNQAMMDLGATVCTPRGPACDRCPVAALCRAKVTGRQEKLPTKKPRPAVPHYDIAVGVVRKAGRVLIDQRPADGLLGGLWEFPGGKIAPGETAEQALVREIREEVGLEVRDLAPLTTVRHAYSHFKVTLHVFVCEWKSGQARAIGCTAVKWVRLDKLDQFAFPAANQKIIAALRERR